MCDAKKKNQINNTSIVVILCVCTNNCLLHDDVRKDIYAT